MLTLVIVTETGWQTNEHGKVQINKLHASCKNYETISGAVHSRTNEDQAYARSAKRQHITEPWLTLFFSFCWSSSAWRREISLDSCWICLSSPLLRIHSIRCLTRNLMQYVHANLSWWGVNMLPHIYLQLKSYKRATITQQSSVARARTASAAQTRLLVSPSPQSSAGRC